MKFFTKEVRIALVAIVGVIIVFFGMNFLKGLSLFSDDNTYFIAFKDVTGLSESSPIYADGFKVGVVKGVSYDYDHNNEIDVEININKNMRIPKGSRAEIVSDMLGNVKVNILLVRGCNEYLNPGLSPMKRNIVHPKTAIIKGVLQHECAQLMQQFFQQKR